LILQKVGNDFYAIAVSTHNDYINGDSYLWLRTHQIGIEWDGCEDLLQEVVDYVP